MRVAFRPEGGNLAKLIGLPGRFAGVHSRKTTWLMIPSNCNGVVPQISTAARTARAKFPFPVWYGPGVRQDYVVGGQGEAAFTVDPPITVNSNITYLEGQSFRTGFGNTPPPTFPQAAGSNNSQLGNFGGNIEFAPAGPTGVPEPSSLALASLCAASLGFIAWRKRKQAATEGQAQTLAV